VGLLVLSGAAGLWLLLRHTSFLMRESREPFRYTFWIDQFEALDDAQPAGVSIANADRLALLHVDLIERLNQRIARRFSLLNTSKLTADAAQQLSSHVRISGTYALRQRDDNEFRVHVIPRVGIGQVVGPEVVADPVSYPLTVETIADGSMPPVVDLRPDRYEQLVERVYSSVASKIYEQIRTDVGDKMRLFPTGYLRAVAYLHEAQDFERSNTVDAYDHAIALYQEARDYFERRRLGRLAGVLLHVPLLGRLERRFQIMEARTRIGYARCLIYRRLISALSGRPGNALFEVHGELQQARETLEALFNRAAGTERWPVNTTRMIPTSGQVLSAHPLRDEDDEAVNRFNAFLAALARRRDARTGRGGTRFEETRQALFEAYAVSALAYAQLQGLQRALTFLKLAAAIDPAAGQDHPLWLLAAAEIEPNLEQKQLKLRRATELAPSFEIAHYRHAWVAEMRLRAQNDLSAERIGSVLEEYDQVLRVNPGNVGARAAQGYLCWLADDAAQARKHYEAGCEIKATVFQTFIGDLNYGLARLSAEAEPASEANRSYGLYASALSADPGVGAYAATAGTRAMHSYYDYISPVMLARYRRFRRAVWHRHMNRQSSQLQVSPRVAGALYAQALNDYGNACFNYFLRFGDRRTLHVAVRSYERAAEVDSQNAIVLYNLYLAYYWRDESGDAQKAQACLERVVDAFPTWRPGLTALSQQLVRSARTQLDSARRELERSRREAEEAAAAATRTRDELLSVTTTASPESQEAPKLIGDVTARPSSAPGTEAAERGRPTPEYNRPGGRAERADAPATRGAVGGEAGLLWDALQSAATEARNRKEEADRELEEAHAEEEACRTQLLKLVNDARDMMGGDLKLGPIFLHFTEPDRGGIAALLNNALLRWEYVDDAVVEALRTWAAISSESADPKDVLEAELLCRYILARYYPSDFDTLYALHNTLLRRVEQESDETRKAALRADIQRCTARLKYSCEYWLNQDPVYYVALQWYQGFFSEAEHLQALQRASVIHAYPRYRRMLADVLASQADAAADPATTIAKYEQALKLCPGTGAFYARLAGAWEKTKTAGHRIEALDNAIFAWEAAQRHGEPVDPDKLRSLELERAMAAHAGEAALERLPVLTPVALEVAADLVPFIADEGGGLQPAVSETVVQMRSRIRSELGVYVPGVRFRGNEGDLPSGTYIIMLNEVPLVMGTITDEQRAGRGADAPVARLTEHLDRVLRANLAGFIGHQEVVNLLDDAGAAPRPQGRELSELVAVLQALVSEGATIAPLTSILAEFRRLRALNTSLVLTVEGIRQLPEVRWALPGNQQNYRIHRLSADFEAELEQTLHRTDDTVVMAILPVPCQEALSAIRSALSGQDDVALLVRNPELRHFLRRLTELEFPHMPVLSEPELRPRLQAQIVSEIEWETA
jgi:tetratricopeptide (TPR) repeat protein